MKVFVVSRHKADCVMTMIVADYSSVIDVLSQLDGTDERIEINFSDVYKKSVK